MNTLTAQLVYKDNLKRYYKLNHKLTKGTHRLLGNKTVDINEALIEEFKRVKDEYKYLMPTDGVDLIAVSDARTHTERLVFPAFQFDNGTYGHSMINIEGQHSMMIHGGDERTIRTDYVYIRLLAKLNGLTFHMEDFNEHIS